MESRGYLQIAWQQDSASISVGRRGWTTIRNLFLLDIPPYFSLMVFLHAMGFVVVVGFESQTGGEWRQKVSACLSLDFNLKVYLLHLIHLPLFSTALSDI